MSRYRGAKLRIIRRLGELPGLTQKTTNRQERPGQHGKTPKKATEYGVRLESQLFRYVKEARRRKGVTGLLLLQLLEMRLDTICFSLGLTPTIASARQLITHGHILVNGKKVNIPSFQCRKDDIVSIRVKNNSKTLIESNLKNKRFSTVPSHLEFDDKKVEGKIKDFCRREDILLDLNELLVVEYYSRR